MVKSYTKTLILICLLLTNRVSCQETRPENEPVFSFNASYIGDVVTNFHGGIKTGSRYLGLANFSLGIKTSSLGLWKGGTLFINGANTHGGDPSADLIGDFHIVSNIETTDLTFLHELWYRQKLGKLEITAGLQDLNSEFVTTEYGSIFLNSTFGTPSTIANNVPSPIFPLTAIGVTFKLKIVDNNFLKFAFFDGLPTSFTDNPHNLRWTIDEEEGIFAISEFTRSGKFNGLEGNYSTGIYYHSQLAGTTGDVSSGAKKYNYGLYLIADQQVWRDPDGTRGLGVFGQFAVSPKNINSHYLYLGYGVAFSGFIPGRGDDVLGIAINRTFATSSLLQEESVIEISYKAILNESLFVQPDIQYIMNPGGSEFSRGNAFSGLLRFGLSF